jgi:hypothetical protein
LHTSKGSMQNLAYFLFSKSLKLRSSDEIALKTVKNA